MMANLKRWFFRQVWCRMRLHVHTVRDPDGAWTCLDCGHFKGVPKWAKCPVPDNPFPSPVPDDPKEIIVASGKGIYSVYIDKMNVGKRLMLYREGVCIAVFKEWYWWRIPADDKDYKGIDS